MSAPAAACILAAGLAAAVQEDPPYAGRELVVMVEERTFGAWPELVELAREFELAHPGLRVSVADQGGAVGRQDKTRFMLAGDLPLDVARIDVTEFGLFLAENALVDLEPYFRSDPGWERSAYLDVVDGMRDGRGHLYGLPSTFTPYVMYFNRDILAHAGLAPPREGWTWDDLLAACRATTRDLDGDGRTDQYGISLTQWLQAVAPWIWQNGGELLDERRERSRLGEPEAVEALAFLRALLHEERVASFDASFENQMAQGLFQAGRAAFYGPVGYWETYRFRHLREFEWDVAPLPRGARAATAIAMTAFVVPRTSREPELAYRFVRELAGERYQRWLAEIGNGVPALRSAALSESFLKPGVAPEHERVFLDVLGDARFLPPLANWRKIESLVQADLQAILLFPETDVGAACRSMAGKIDEYLARERERHARPRLPAGAMLGSVGIALAAASALFVSRRAGPWQRRRDRQGRLMVAPWAIGFAAFFLGPAVVTLVLSLAEWSPLRPLADVRWVGAENYARLAQDPTFAASLRATSTYALLSVPLGLALALALALLVRAESAGTHALRTLLYLPAIVSPVIVAAVWRWILDADQGLLNRFLLGLGIDAPAWLRDPDWVVPSFVLMSLWGVGAQMLIFLAAMKALDPTLEEAARVDGAGAMRRFWHVTLPALTPVVLFNLVIGVINAFQLFAQPYVMTQGGPGDASRFLVLYLYESGFRHLDMGYASAIAWVLFVILGILCLALMRGSRRWVYYAARRGA
ncbi:MAG TPA: extracellular solute-binding protein [Planctomycetota bacterium]|nr:extracellular solute-binding protein [Planctomycetota bacterium]